MDYRSRVGQSTPTQDRPLDSNTGGTAPAGGAKGGRKRPNITIAKAGFIFVVVVATVVLVSLLALIFTAKSTSTNSQINGSTYQAVFLNSQDGQVYFGKLSELNKQYYKLTDIYYVRVQNSVQPGQADQSQQSISLAKLGCEIHGPRDVMYVNRDQVLFWENLRNDDADNSQVIAAIKAYQESPDSKKTCKEKAAAETTTPATSTTTTPKTTTTTTPKTTTTR